MNEIKDVIEKIQYIGKLTEQTNTNSNNFIWIILKYASENYQHLHRRTKESPC